MKSPGQGFFGEKEQAQGAGIFDMFLVDHSHKCEATITSLSRSRESNKDSVPRWHFLAL